jgi:hypothetical protein
MEARARKIRSFQELRRRVPEILQRVNADPALALRAAANPLLALEEMGYDLTREVRAQVERHVRFSRADRERLDALSREIARVSPEPFDPDEPEELERILFQRLKLPPLPQRVRIPAGPAKTTSRKAPTPVAARLHPLAPPVVPPGAPKAADPLEALRGAHAVVPPLLEYRRIQSSQPPLAPREVYERLRRHDGTRVPEPRRRIHARLKSAATPG